MFNKKTTKSNWRMGKRIFFGFIILIIVGFVTRSLMFVSSSTTCAIFTRTSSVQGFNELNYTFKVNEETYSGQIGLYHLKNKFKSLEEIHKLECVKLEYSNYWPVLNRIIDKRVLDE